MKSVHQGNFSYLFSCVLALIIPAYITASEKEPSFILTAARQANMRTFALLKDGSMTVTLPYAGMQHVLQCNKDRTCNDCEKIKSKPHPVVGQQLPLKDMEHLLPCQKNVSKCTDCANFKISACQSLVEAREGMRVTFLTE